MNSVFLKSKAAEIVYNYLQTKYNYNEYYFTISKNNAINNPIAYLQPKKMVLLQPESIACTNIPTQIKNPVEAILASIYNAANGLELYKSLTNHSKELPSRWNLFSELRSLNIYLTALVANTEVSDVVHGDYITFKELVSILEVNIANLMVQLEELKKTMKRKGFNPDSHDREYIQSAIEKHTTALNKLKHEKEQIIRPDYKKVVGQLNPSERQHFNNTILELHKELSAQEAYTSSIEEKLLAAEETIRCLRKQSNTSTESYDSTRDLIALEPPVVISSQNASYQGTVHKKERTRIGSGTFFRSTSEASLLKPSSQAPSIN